MDDEFQHKQRAFLSDVQDFSKAMAVVNYARRRGRFLEMDSGVAKALVELLQPLFFVLEDPSSPAEAAAFARASGWPAELFLSQTERPVRFHDLGALQDAMAKYGPVFRAVSLVEGLTGKALETLKDLPALERLSVTIPSPLLDREIRALAQLQGLRSLEIRNGQGLSELGANSLTEIAGLRSLRLSSCPRAFQSRPEALAGLKELEDLVIPASCLPDGTVQSLLTCPRLRSLSFSYSNTTLRDQHVMGLERLEGLKQFEIDCLNKLSLPAFRSIGRAEGLKSLKLSWCDVLDREAKALGLLRRLEGLTLKHCPHWTVTEFRRSFSGNPLRSLRIEGHGRLFEEPRYGFFRKYKTLFDVLCEFDQLESLSLPEFDPERLTRESFYRGLGRLTSLRRLCLQTIEGFSEHGEPCRALRKLEDLKAWNVTVDFLRSLSVYPELQHLAISTYSSDAQAMEPLAELKSLRSLRFMRPTRLEVGQLRGLAEMKALELIDLRSCAIPNAEPEEIPAWFRPETVVLGFGSAG